ncbi:MAG: hypothetical protein AB1921_04175, partial [Thermodesulfobacteriota bacterium]
EQAFLGDASVRSLDDVSESSQYEMASALASGDERVIELARLRADVERLHMLEGAHHQEQAKLASEKNSLGWDIERLEKRIADLAYLDEHNPGYIVGEKFQGEVDGKKFDKRRDFGRAMMDRAMAEGGRHDFKEDSRPSVALGKINGFDVSATFARSQREGVAWFISGMRLSRDGHASGFDVGQPDAKGMKAGEVDPQGFAARIVNAVNSLSAELSRARHELSEAQKKLERTRKKIGAPFEFANEMAGKVAEAARLEQELAAEGEAARKAEQDAKQGKAGKSPAAQPEQPAAPAGEEQYSTRAAREARKPAEAGVTAAMVREAYPASQGWEASLTPEGHLHFRHAPTGEEVTVELVEEITPDAMSFAVSRGRAPRPGEGIAGSFRRGRITLSLLADQWTVRHEQYHEFVDAGIVTRADQEALQKAIVRHIQKGTLPFQSASVEGEVEPGGEEDQARYVEEMLKTRVWDREQGGVRAVLQKIADFIDGLVNLFHRTARGVVRDMESGTIANRYREREAAIRETEPAVKNAAGVEFSPEHYSTPAPVMGPAVTRDLEADRTFANRIFEQRDVGRHFAQVEAANLQKRVQALAGGKSKRRVAMPWTYDRENKRSNDSDLLDMAMMLWRDTGGDEQKLAGYRIWAQAQLARPDTAPKNRLRYKEHVAVIDRALALSPDEKALVDEIGGRYDQAFTVANANKVVQTHRDNYARRLWALPKKPGAELRGGSGAYGFKVTTTAAKERTLDTILDGWKAGYDLAVKGLTGSYGEYMQELETVLANKDFVAQGYNTR